MKETLEQKLERARKLVDYMEKNFVWNEIAHIYQSLIRLKNINKQL